MTEGSNVVRVFTPESEQSEVPMTEKRAMDLAIFAINTWLYPDASSDGDCANLDTEGDQAVKVLAQIRERLNAH